MDFFKHQSSSIEDLILLFEAEKEAVININQTRAQLHSEINTSNENYEMISHYLSLIDYNV